MKILGPCIPLAMAAIAALAMSASDPTFRTTVRLVKVDAYVYDRRSHVPILNLAASDFVIHDEDQQREIVYFGNDSGPVDIVFLLDVSGSVREVLPGVADAAAGALATLTSEDRAAVMAFSRRTLLTAPLTSDVGAVGRGICAALSARIGLDTDINQALWSAAGYLHNTGGTSRRAIVVLTDNMQETRISDSLVDEQLAEASAVVDGFLIRGPIPVPHFKHPGILGFARNTGGEVIEGGHPAAALAGIIRRIKYRYNIHFRPAESATAKPRVIHVDLSPDARRRYPNAVIRARRISPRAFTGRKARSFWGPRWRESLFVNGQGAT